MDRTRQPTAIDRISAIAWPWLAPLLLVAAMAREASAKTWTVGEAIDDFVEIQNAIDAASDADVILVRPRTMAYLPFRIAGKALTIRSMVGRIVVQRAPGGLSKYLA